MYIMLCIAVYCERERAERKSRERERKRERAGSSEGERERERGESFQICGASLAQDRPKVGARLALFWVVR